MVDVQSVFGKIDRLIERIQASAIEPEFSNDVARRSKPIDFSLSDATILEIMIKTIAYSQQAPAKRITEMDHDGVFSNVFGSFKVATVARMDPETLLTKYWNDGLSPMRFRSKVAKMIGCAVSLQKITTRHGSYMQFLRKCEFPNEIRSLENVDQFWIAFELARIDSPNFFKNLISLCHLLQWLGFPCAKPDKVVMEVATRLGMANERRQHSERECRDVIKMMQTFAAQRKMKVPVVDLIFLIEGGQTDATQYVKPSYYSGDPRNHSSKLPARQI
jgi:hypothetical protein